MKYEFWTYEELEAKLRELNENNPEFFVTVMRVMDGGRFFVTVEQEGETLQECDWCGESAKELGHPHMFDLVIGKKMCRGCWEHDRDVYKGSYGEDIGEFKPINA